MTFETKTPTFFTVVHKQHAPDQLLRIPKKCLAKLGAVLPKTVKLKVPNGEIWKVDYKKDDHCFWLSKGWTCFADHYSINPPYCLVFTFDGEKGFDLSILDMRAFEIEYPTAEEHCSTSDESDAEQSHHVTESSQEEIGGRKNENAVSCSKTRTIQLKIGARESTAYRKSQTFESEYPYFMVAMKLSNIQPKAKLYIPLKFADKYLTEGKGEVILVVSDGRTRTFEYHSQWYKYNRNRKNETYICREWRRLVEQNNLKVGDVCVFELVKNTSKQVIKVTTFQNETEKANHSLPQVNRVSTLKRRRCVLADESLNGFKGNRQNLPGISTKTTEANDSTNPSFSVIMHSTYLTRSLVYVPLGFAGRYFKEMRGDIILYVQDGRKWNAVYIRKVRRGKKDGVNILKGWKQFVSDTKLRDGDVCDFELIKSKPITLKVDIVRDGKIEYPIAQGRCSTSNGSNAEQSYDVTKSSQEKIGRKKKNVASCSKTSKIIQLKIAGGEYTAFRKAQTFESEYPYFMVAMKISNIQPKSKLYIPLKFADTYLIEGKGEVILVVSDERTSTFEYHSRWYKFDRNGRKEIYLCREWKRLVEQHSLKLGDVCVFELVNNISKKVFKVTIFQNQTDKATHSLPQVNGIDTRKRKRCALADESENGFEGHCQILPGISTRNTEANDSRNPSFSVIMHSTYLTKSLVYVPLGFAGKYFKEMRGDIILYVQDGRKWNAVYIRKVRRCNREGTTISNGWKEFVFDNKLKAGDVCDFELIKSKPITLKVEIFRDGEKLKGLVSSIGKDRQLRSQTKPVCSTASISSSKSSVRAGLTSSCHMHLRLPYFFPEYIRGTQQYVTLKTEGKSWPVKFIRRRGCSGVLSAGWRAFAKGNHLRQGDVCVFERDQKSNDLVFQVLISRCQT